MARKFFDNVRHLIATTGTGNIVPGSAPSGWQSLSDAGAADGDEPSYELRDGANWELGYLLLSSSLTVGARTVVSSSEIADAPLSLSGTAILTIVLLARDAHGENPLINHVTGAGNVTIATDLYDVYVINKGTGAATGVTIGNSRTRPVTIKDGKGDADANNITVSLESAQNIDADATYVIDSPYGGVTVFKHPSGTGWLTK